MQHHNEEYDGALISELGVKRYLKASKDIKLSNIDFLIRGAAAQKAWEECSFGCHGPTYRVLKRPSTRGELLAPIENISPAVAGAVDGIHHQTLGKIDRIASGVNRTAEGLHVAGGEKFDKVGDENTAAYLFATTMFEKIVSFELAVLDNPIAQSVMTIVSEYTTALPEWLIQEALEKGALRFPEKIDTVWLLKASAMGIVENINRDNIAQVASMLNDPAQKLVGKQIGKKLAPVISLAIASAITKMIMSQSADLPVLKRQLASLRRSARKLKGGLGGAMITLLSTQGVLDKAAQSSRQLQQTCPHLWNVLRFKLNGANMAYFLIENMVREYVDRLALLEQSPKEFANVLAALIKARQTRQIFLP